MSRDVNLFLEDMQMACEKVIPTDTTKSDNHQRRIRTFVLIIQRLSGGHHRL